MEKFRQLKTFDLSLLQREFHHPIVISQKTSFHLNLHHTSDWIFLMMRRSIAVRLSVGNWLTEEVKCRNLVKEPNLILLPTNSNNLPRRNFYAHVILPFYKLNIICKVSIAKLVYLRKNTSINSIFLILKRKYFQTLDF